MPWSVRFDDPIVLPKNGRELVTLKDAGNYITKLPKAEHDAPEWQPAMEALILVAEKGGPADRPHARLEPARRTGVRYVATGTPLGQTQTSEEPMTVFVYINTGKEVGDIDYIKVFANRDAAERWLEENDPEGVAFEYEVLE
jgi:hypothetical protein